MISFRACLSLVRMDFQFALVLNSRYFHFCGYGLDGRGGPTLPSGRREPHHRRLGGRWEPHTWDDVNCIEVRENRRLSNSPLVSWDAGPGFEAVRKRKPTLF